MEHYQEYMERLREISSDAWEFFCKYFARIQHPLSEVGRKYAVWIAFVLGRDYGEEAAKLAVKLYNQMVVAEGWEMGRPKGWKEP